MKKFLFIALLLCIKQLNAQIINPGFETWSSDAAVPSAMNPNSGNGTTGWWDYNVFNSSFVGSSPLSVFRCDTAHSGSYSARIETVVYTTTSWNLYKAWGIPYIGHDYYDTLGILYNGAVNETAQTSSPGFPFTQKINQFSFYYQYKPNGVDTAECRVSLVKSGTLIAGGVFKTNTATGSTWQQANVTMYYLNNLTPDTMYVLFSASSLDKKPKPGSVLLIDDISTSLGTGIDQIQSHEEQVAVYPNPSSTHITVETNTSGKQTLQLVDVSGRLVLHETVSGKTTLDVGNLNPGVYTLSLIGNETLINKRVVIVR